MAIFGYILGYTILLLLLCVTSFSFFRRFYQRGRSTRDEEKPPAVSICQNLQQAKSILDGSCFKKSGLSTILKMRAGPNGRLIRAFGIDNAFTTVDVEYHREFVNRAGTLINLNSIRWESLANDIEALLHGNIKRQRTSNSTVLFSRLLQITVLRAILPVLFPNRGLPDLSEEEQDDIAYYIADKVNSLWIESKTSQQIDPNGLQSLKEACQKLLPGVAVGSPRDNPLNLILPAFETLWRIVLRCFIEVQFRNKHDFESNLALLREYRNKPTSETFTKADIRDISVSHIVNEALRLYPPTKRVYRHIWIGSETKPDLAAVDIEYIHRDSNVWGTDATKFRPSRWRKREMNGIMTSSFSPFGMKPLFCPARKVFGPRIIGLLVASLSLALDQLSEWELVGEQDPPSQELLENSRDSYESLGIRVKEKN